MSSENKQILHREYTCLGDSDIHKVLPKAKILKYSELAQYTDIHQLIKKPKDYFILLYEDAEINGMASGHWSCVFMDLKNNICFFESYGGSPDTQRKWVNQNQLNLLGECKPFLTELLNKASETILYNNMKYQDDKNQKMSTCGRHVLNVLLCLLNQDMGMAEYFNYMHTLKYKLNKSYDFIVSELINI